MNIHQRLAKAMEAVTYIQKEKKAGMRYSIVSHDAVTAKVRPALLAKHKDERVLVFCGVTKIADSLGIPSYHNKSKEKEVFEDFAEGEGNHLAVVKIGNTGVTYKPHTEILSCYI